MKHLTEEEWIEYYYGESADRHAVQEHLEECAECAAMGQELALDLSQMREVVLPDAEPERGAQYSESVWRSLQLSITPYPRAEKARRPWRWTGKWGWGLAGAAVALAALVLVAFFSGRWWEQRREPQMAAANGAAPQRVILYVIGDHLDRSQRLLAELNDPDEAAADHGLQATARDLLTENRLYRQSSERRNTAAKGAAEADDSTLQTILDDLEPVLVELANQPDNLNRAEIERLRKELNTGSLLFEIRVLRTKVRQQQPNASGTVKEGSA
jgi:hypothetical protein